MSAKTKIVVLKFRELVYTIVFIGLLILLAVLLFLMFRPKKEPQLPEAAVQSSYIPGSYSTSLRLSDQSVNLVVCVDSNHINRISLENLEETVETLYPLVPSALQNLSAQILADQSLDSITYNPSSQYTSELLLSAISKALQKARIPSD